MLDFGIARAAGRLQATQEPSWKGKPSYMAPSSCAIGRSMHERILWATAVVLWECLTGCRLFQGENHHAVARKVLHKAIDPPSKVVADLPTAIDEWCCADCSVILRSDLLVLPTWKQR